MEHTVSPLYILTLIISLLNFKHNVPRPQASTHNDSLKNLNSITTTNNNRNNLNSNSNSNSQTYLIMIQSNMKKRTTRTTLHLHPYC